MLKFKLIAAVLMLAVSLKAEKRFEFTTPAKEAYDLAMSLRFDEARSLLQKIKSSDPDNLIVYHIENYIDFFTVYISENQALFYKLEPNKEFRIEKIREGDPGSPYYLYLQANVRLHWALARLKFEEYFTAFREVNRAFKLLQENSRKFPDFMPNKKDLGILHAMVGTIPDEYKWGVELLSSLNGTIDQGRKEIEEVLEYARRQPFIYENETRVLYAYLLFYLDDAGDAAWEILKNGNHIDPKTNPLACFTLANLAMRSGKNDEAANILSNRPKGAQYFPFPCRDFMLGLAKLRRLDNDAGQYFQLFLKNFNGRHFIKEAYQKLAWLALIQNDSNNFNRYNKLCLQKGNSVVGSDKNAHSEAASGIVPDIILLKARLLFDGGYYQRAYDLLKRKSSANFTSTRHQIEFTYRLGRILHMLHRHNEALRFYQRTIDSGADKPYYFACNAALQAGLLLEDLKRYVGARNYFQQCLKIKPEEHASGLHQQAKAGLERLKGKS
ncbi:MAG TPA: tetratricopeptide repeat protein [Saprospiraceae bacterium]|nr:tetratricopeptide repeat protein [Saprospiraceae bacterium]